MGKISELAQKIADNIDRSWDDMLKERLKSDIVSYRATIIRREHDKTGMFADTLVHEISLDLIKVDANECGAPTDCNVLRTKFKVPKPVRVKGNSNFQYVGSLNGTRPFGYIKPEELGYLQYSRYSNEYGRYTYVNGYIYVFHTEAKAVKLRYVPSNPFELIDLKDCDGNSCFKDEEIDDDLEAMIKSFIYEELGLVRTENTKDEVKTDEAES